MPNDRKPSRSPRKPATRKTTARPSTRSGPAARDEDALQRDVGNGTELEEDLPRYGSRPIAVGGSASVSGEDDLPAATAASEEDVLLSDPVVPGILDTDTAATAPSGDVVVEKPAVEIAVGLVGLLLALSTILKATGWYKVTVNGLPQNATGWSTSIWGPLVFFLGLAVVAIIALRLLKIPVQFPLEASTIIEGIGYLCVGLLLLSRFFVPDNPFTAPQPNVGGWFVSVVLAAGLFLLAGMMSGSAPLVLKPGWLAGTPGKIGAVILAVSLIAGAAFGFVNEPPGPPPPKPPKACGTDFPKVAGMSSLKLTESELPNKPGATLCTGSVLTVPASAKTVGARLGAAFKDLGWKYRIGTTPKTKGNTRVGPVRNVQMLGPRYGGIIQLTPITAKTTSVFILLGDPQQFGRCTELGECLGVPKRGG